MVDFNKVISEVEKELGSLIEGYKDLQVYKKPDKSKYSSVKDTSDVSEENAFYDNFSNETDEDIIEGAPEEERSIETLLNPNSILNLLHESEDTVCNFDSFYAPMDADEVSAYLEKEKLIDANESKELKDNLGNVNQGFNFVDATQKIVKASFSLGVLANSIKDIYPSRDLTEDQQRLIKTLNSAASAVLSSLNKLVDMSEGKELVSFDPEVEAKLP